MSPRFIVEQKITAFVNRYAVYKATGDGQKAELLALAEQKRLAFKEKVTFFSDEGKTNPAFTFRAEKMMDIHGKFLVEDNNDQLIGSFKKEFASSLLNSTWNILDAKDNARLRVNESSNVLAILRRTLDLVPFIGEILDIIIAFFRYHFVFTDTASSQIVGRYRKTTLFRDHYLFTMEDAAFTGQDWRVLVAMTVALDALQGR